MKRESLGCKAMRPQASPRQALVVDAAWLKAHLNDPDLVILHVGDKASYEAGHIPGARAVSLNDISVSDHGGHGLMLEMPPADDLRHRLEALGISDKSRVIVYFGKDWVSPTTRIIFSRSILSARCSWLFTLATGVSFSMLTLAFAQLLYAVAFKWTSITGGSDGLAGIPRRPGPFGLAAFNTRTGFYYLVSIALAAAFAFCWALVRSPFGAVLRGIRENEAKTLALGYNTRLYKIAVVVLAYGFGGLAGALYAPFAGFANTELVVRVDAAVLAGVDPALLVLDPGLGFAKNAGHNWTLLRRLDVLLALGFPVLVGASRKRFLGQLLADAEGVARPPAGRDTATAVITGLAADRGAWGVRVHDVAASMDAVAVATAWHLGSSRARTSGDGAP